MKQFSKNSTRWLCVSAIFMSINIVLSSFGVPVPGGHFYLNDIIICTAALMFDPVSAFLIGGVGAFLGDVFFYPAPMFVSLVTHGLQAVIIALISRNYKNKGRLVTDCLAVFFGGVVMVIGYTLGRAYIYATPAYALVKLPYEILQALVGAVVGIILTDKVKIKHKIFH